MAVFCPTHLDMDQSYPHSHGSETDPKLPAEKDSKKKPKAAAPAMTGCEVLTRTAAPPFRDLPLDNDLNVFYYSLNRFTGAYSPCRTWCFLGEITNNDMGQMSFWRNRILVTDRHGQRNIPICFYPESGYFDYSTMKLGHTIAVIFGEQHFFLDGTVGLRIEELNYTKVIPCGLKDLLALSKHYSLSGNKCWGCGQSDGSGDSLKKCSACKTAHYCNQACQKEDWKKRHKIWCKAMKDFLFLACIDYQRFQPEMSWR